MWQVGQTTINAGLQVCDGVSNDDFALNLQLVQYSHTCSCNKVVEHYHDWWDVECLHILQSLTSTMNLGFNDVQEGEWRIYERFERGRRNTLLKGQWKTLNWWRLSSIMFALFPRWCTKACISYSWQLFTAIMQTYPFQKFKSIHMSPSLSSTLLIHTLNNMKMPNRK